MKYLLAGIGVGSAAAILFAPQPGRESQQWVASQARDGAESARGGASRAAKQVREWMEAGRQRAVGAVQAGKDAYREATQTWRRNS